ncbi:MAG TPA: DUF3073 domain-containing protein [Acidothermaceae bacterium]
MGRGRAKAKQTKVARELKYSSGGTDLDALRKELASAASTPATSTPSWSKDEADDADEADDFGDADEDDGLDDSYGASGSR